MKLTFCSGRGQYESHALTKSDGTPNTAPYAGKPYDGITAAEIVSMAQEPPTTDKAQARWFIPSVYADFDARDHARQKEAGAFHWLAVDVDTGSPTLEVLAAALGAVLGDCARVIYSTRSAKPDLLKWRVLVPLASPLSGAEYGAMQEALFALLALRGIECDPALDRHGQLIYLPNRGAFYQHEIHKAARLDLTPSHPVRGEAKRMAEARESARRALLERRERKAAARGEFGDSHGMKPGEVFNARNDLASTLVYYGWTPSRNGRDFRSPFQTSKTYATRIIGEGPEAMWVSLSSSDAAQGFGITTKKGATAGDAFDLFCHFEHGGDMDAAVRAYGDELRQEAGPIGNDWPEPSRAAVSPQSEGANVEAEDPQPLLREIPQGEAYPVEALGPLREAVEAVQGLTLAPVAIPAASALTVAALAVQGFIDVDTLGGPRPVSLYALTVAQSGERKSSCDAPLMAGLRAFEKEQAKEQRDAMASWENAYALWKGERDRILNEAKKGKGEKRVSAQADLDAMGKEPAAPPFPGRTVAAPTIQGITRQMREGMPTLGIFSDEGGRFLGGYSMSSDNRLATMAALNDLWQGAEIKVALSGEGSFTLYGRRLSAHLMVQPGVARAFMADPMGGDTGLLPRFLICEPPSTIGTRLQSKMRQDGFALPAFASRLTAILETPLPMDPDTRELTPRIIPLAPAARELLAAFADHVEAQQATGGEYANITGYASKAAEQAARIAGVMTAWTDLQAPEVTIETMQGAIALAQFYLSEARRLSDAAVISAEVERAETLRKWLLSGWGQDAITPRDIVQRAPIRGLRESPAAKAAISVLVKHGWLIRLPVGVDVRGKARKEAYRIVRARDEV